MGFMMVLYTVFNVAVMIFVLLLLVRFVNAVEKMAIAGENQERQMGRLATAVEQLWTLYNSSRPGNPPRES